MPVFWQRGQSRTLDRLVAQGLVTSQPAGSARLYRLNREHLLCRAVLELIDARTTFLLWLRESLAGWPLPCEHASLFGSVARGDASITSDVDVLVLRPMTVDADDPAWQGQLRDLEADVLHWTGNHLAWFETTRHELLSSRDEPLMSSWRAEAVHLAGDRLHIVLDHEAT